MLSLFRRDRDDPRRARMEALKGSLRAHLGLAECDGLTVSEIVCPDPACPGTETVVLVMKTGRKTVALKIAKPLQEVGNADIAALALPSEA